MFKKKIFGNRKNLAIATLALAITVGSIIALVSTFVPVLQFAETEEEAEFVESEEVAGLPEPETTAGFPEPETKAGFPEPASAPVSAPPVQYSAPPPTSLSVIDNIVNNLEWGNIVFNTPQKIRLEEPTIIELVLSPTHSIEELQSSLESQEQIESAEIRISNQMAANLVGTGFKIEALRPQEQAISSEQTQWKWAVTPTKSGSQNLELTLSAIINISGQERQLVIETFKKTIEVEVSVGQRVSTFVAGHWEWLWASLLVPTAPFLWKLYQKKRGKNLPV
jgi:hypothetical protein